MRRWFFPGCPWTKFWTSYSYYPKTQPQAQARVNHDRNFATLVSWGLNDHGQCGVPSHSPLLSGPEEVELGVGPLTGTEALCAGPSHAAIATAAGEVYTWGDGAHGKLGLGSNRLGSFLPARIEALVGRAHITHIALGHRWSFFLDCSGELYASGRFATEELEFSTRQGLHRQNMLLKESAQAFSNKSHSHGLHDAFQSGMPLGDGFFELSTPQALGNASTATPSSPSQSARPLEIGGEVAGGGISNQLLPFIDHTHRLEEIFYTRQIKGNGNGVDERDWLTDQSASFSAHPTIGRKLSPPFHWSLESPLPFLINRYTGRTLLASNTVGSRLWTITASPNAARSRVYGLDSDGLVSFVSLIHDKEGEEPSLALEEQQRCTTVNRVLERNGGAVSLVSCDEFDAALTKSGRVVAWVAVNGHGEDGHERLETVGADNRGYKITFHSTPAVRMVEYEFLPMGQSQFDPLQTPVRIKLMSGSGRTLLLSDGERVWTVDNVLCGEKASCIPRQEMCLSEEGVARVSAGHGCFAVVSGAGRLWMWGNLLTSQRMSNALRHSEEEGFGHWSYSASGLPTGTDALRKSQSTWLGLGSPRPVVVPGLHNVSNVALGDGYALALVA
jgi:alpha-tubulin suppressor-like RCC1 family protein